MHDTVTLIRPPGTLSIGWERAGVMGLCRLSKRLDSESRTGICANGALGHIPPARP